MLDPAHVTDLRAAANAAARLGDHRLAASYYEALITADPGNPLRTAGRIKSLLRLAQISRKARDHSRALDLARTALELDPAHVAALRAAAYAAARLGDHGLAASYYEALNSVDPENPSGTAGLITLLAESGQTEQAAMMFEAALDRSCAGAAIHRLVDRLNLKPELVQRSVKWAEAIGEGASEGERKIAGDILLRFSGRITPPSPDSSGTVNVRPRLLEWVRHTPSDAELLRAPLAEDWGNEVVIAPAEQPAATVLVFTGLADRTNVPVTLLDRYLAALNVKAVYLRDRSRFLFNNGIGSIADDFAGTVDHLKRLVDGLGDRPVMTLGTSAGGYAALRYGLALGAQTVIGFSAPTNITASFLEDDGRGRAVARRLQALPAEALDVRPLVRNAAGRTKIHLVYGADMPQDERHALYLQGEPGVTLYALPDVDAHATLLTLGSEGKLLPFLRRYLLEAGGPGA